MDGDAGKRYTRKSGAHPGPTKVCGQGTLSYYGIYNGRITVG